MKDQDEDSQPMRFETLKSVNVMDNPAELA